MCATRAKTMAWVGSCWNCIVAGRHECKSARWYLASATRRVRLAKPPLRRVAQRAEGRLAIVIEQFEEELLGGDARRDGEGVVVFVLKGVCGERCRQ